MYAIYISRVTKLEMFLKIQKIGPFKRRKNKSLFSNDRMSSQPKYHIAKWARTYTQTDAKVKTVDTLSGFQEFVLQPYIKDQSNKF